ncbi:MAG: DNA-binding protein [Chloroflexi bacterium]|nr:DNA-binding protein [Chloroflexota bacterium]
MGWAILAVSLTVVACTQSIQPAAAPVARAPASAIASTDAAQYVGKRATVCGPVVDSRYASNARGKPTFLNFDLAYPNHTFTVVIWDGDRSEFRANLEKHYRSKKVCATGLIETFRGKPQIIARDASDLQVIE